MFTIVFVIHCNIFIVLPIRMKICGFNDFPFFTRQNLRVAEVLSPERARSGSGAQFVQACNTACSRGDFGELTQEIS